MAFLRHPTVLKGDFGNSGCITAIGSEYQWDLLAFGDTIAPWKYLVVYYLEGGVVFKYKELVILIMNP